jgi:hypothetical protein
MGRGSAPGIVQHVAWRFPKTLGVFTNPLWTALHPGAQLHQKAVDQLLLKLDPEVREQFVYFGRDGTVQRDWSSILSCLWAYPQPDLAMDYLAAYLLLCRELRESGRGNAADLAQTWLVSALEVLRSCPILCGIRTELSRFVSVHFLCDGDA